MNAAPEPQPSRCPACGAAVPGGQAGCQALLHEMAAQAYGDPRYGAVYTLAFDAYCMQHLDLYCLSAKSYAAHLTRLCCGLEHGGEPKVYDAIRRWLDGRVTLEKPAAPADLGPLTIADVRAAATPQALRALVQAWAQSVWGAYAAQQDLARAWVQAALAAGLARKKHAAA